MIRTDRPGLTPAQKEDLWRRWQAGDSLSEIARVLDKQPGSIHWVVSAQGGIAPPPRTRSRLALTLAERETISRGLAAGVSVREIARTLGRAPSTISREIRRHGGRTAYRAVVADAQAWDRARRPKPCRLAGHSRLRRWVAGKLRLRWSPEQIAGWLRHTFPGEADLQLSHETIYRSLYVQARGVLRRELLRSLRTRRTMRRSRRASRRAQGRGQIPEAVPISARPPDVADRAVPGHWEGDLIAGSGNTHLATLVERTSRFTVLVKVPGKDTAGVVRALTKQVRRLPAHLQRSLTWDRGMEMADHRAFTVSTGVQVYFCDPQSPWQRGTNENTNGLLRQYFPKGTDLSRIPQRTLNRVADELNGRPRKTLGFVTPAEVFHQAVASIP